MIYFSENSDGLGASYSIVSNFGPPFRRFRSWYAHDASMMMIIYTISSDGLPNGYTDEARSLESKRYAVQREIDIFIKLIIRVCAV